MGRALGSKKLSIMAKTQSKFFLMCKMTDKEGRKFDKALKTSDAYLIPNILKDNESMTIKIVETSPEAYKTLFK